MQRANFVEETAVSIAGTNGNGDVTLTPVYGYPSIERALGTGTVFIPYVIEDTYNFKMESGLGKVVGGVLTRLKPQTTWDAATDTYNNFAPAPLEFGSNPEPGSIRVRIALTAENSPPLHPGMVNAGLSTEAWNQYPISPHLGAQTGSGAGVSSSPGTEFHTYYRLDYGGRLTGLQIDLTGSYANSIIRLAVYDIGPDALPSRKLAQTHNIDASTTGLRTLNDPSLWVHGQNVFLNPGWYTVMYQTSYGISVRGLLNGNSAGTGPSPLGRTGPSYAGYKTTLTNFRSNGAAWEELPAEFVPGAMGIMGAQIAWVGMRVQP
jgi:hypothetical protein